MAIRLFPILLLIFAAVSAHADDYGSGPFGGRPTRSADPHGFSPHGCITLPVPRTAVVVTLRVKMDPATAAATFNRTMRTSDDPTISGTTHRVTVPIQNSRLCVDGSRDAESMTVQVLGWSARR
jgi:hypothetical protein